MFHVYVPCSSLVMQIFFPCQIMLVVVVCSGGMIVSSQWLKSILTSQPTSKNDSYDPDHLSPCTDS